MTHSINIVKEFSTIFPKFVSFVGNNKIPPKISKTKKISLKISQDKISQEEVSKQLLAYMKHENGWDKSGNKTNFNQIQKLIKNNVVKNVVRNVQTNQSYLELIDDTKI